MLANYLILLFALQNPAISAEAFPRAPQLPNYTGVRVRLTTGAEEAKGQIGLRGMGGHISYYDVQLPANSSQEYACSVYCSETGFIDVKFQPRGKWDPADAVRTRVDLEPQRPMAFVLGDLAEAEKLSDITNLPLTDIVRLAAEPQWLDSFALDGFSGIVAKGLPGDLVDGYVARGGTVISPFLEPGAAILLKPANLAAIAAESFNLTKLRRREICDRSSRSIKIAFAAAAIGLLACIVIHRRPVISVLFVCAVSLTFGIWADASYLGSPEPAVFVSSPGSPILKITGFDISYYDKIRNSRDEERRVYPTPRSKPVFNSPNPYGPYSGLQSDRRIVASIVHLPLPADLVDTPVNSLSSPGVRSFVDAIERRIAGKVVVRTDLSLGIISIELPRR
ncbi:MAG: hypothetical protein ACKVS6_02645 [Planctomycetota bacterium]